MTRPPADLAVRIYPTVKLNVDLVVEVILAVMTDQLVDQAVPWNSTSVKGPYKNLKPRLWRGFCNLIGESLNRWRGWPLGL